MTALSQHSAQADSHTNLLSSSSAPLSLFTLRHHTISHAHSGARPETESWSTSGHTSFSCTRRPLWPVPYNSTTFRPGAWMTSAYARLCCFGFVAWLHRICADRFNLLSLMKVLDHPKFHLRIPLLTAELRSRGDQDFLLCFCLPCPISFCLGPCRRWDAIQWPAP